MRLFFIKVEILLRTHSFESLFLLPITLFYGWYLLTVMGLFYGAPVLLVFLLVFLGAVTLLSKRPAFCSLSNITLSIFLLFFGCIAFITHPIEPISEGRDQGTFLNSAILLNDNHGIPFQVPEAFPFFDIYGPGKALNFPGLAYTESGALVPEFPLGYIVWLAGFLTIFGLSGAALANILLYIFSGLLFSTLVKRVLPTTVSFLATLIFMGSFLPLWFLSFTLTENLALFLFLLTTESTLRFRITKDRVTLSLALASAFALALTRIEGWIILLATVLLLAGGRIQKNWLKIYLFQKPLWPAFCLLLAFLITVWTVWTNSPYYTAITKALFKSAGTDLAHTSLIHEILPLYFILWKYGLFMPLFGGLVSALYLWKKRRIQLLIPFFLSFVTLPYLVLPHITLDAPWMLRRFLFTLYPALFLSLCFGVGILMSRYEVRKQNFGWFLFLGVLFFLQIPLIQQFSQTSYPTTLSPQVQELSTYFSNRDLLLIDKDVTGDNFMMPGRALSLLYERPAVYFFNPADFEKLDTKRFEHVFLLFPEGKQDFYDSILQEKVGPTREFIFRNDHSFRNTDMKSSVIPEKQTLITEILITEVK